MPRLSAGSVTRWICLFLPKQRMVSTSVAQDHQMGSQVSDICLLGCYQRSLPFFLEHTKPWVLSDKFIFATWKLVKHSCWFSGGYSAGTFTSCTLFRYLDSISAVASDWVQIRSGICIRLWSLLVEQELIAEIFQWYLLIQMVEMTTCATCWMLQVTKNIHQEKKCNSFFCIWQRKPPRTRVKTVHTSNGFFAINQAGS